MTTVVLTGIGCALLLLGLTLITIGVYGVLRLPTTYGQLHAQGLATGPGVIVVLASSIATRNAAIITAAGLAIAFIVLTSPVSGHAIASAARRGPARSGVPRARGARAGRRLVVTRLAAVLRGLAALSAVAAFEAGVPAERGRSGLSQGPGE